MDDHRRSRFESLAAQAELIKAQLQASARQLGEARQSFARSKSEADRRRLAERQAAAEALSEEFERLVQEMGEALDLTSEQIEALGQPARPPGRLADLQRSELTQDKVPPTALIDDLLPAALDRVKGLLPSGWLDADGLPGVSGKPLAGTDTCLSLVRGLRPESEFTTVQRMRQSIRAAEAFLADKPHYDHFAGATLVPQLMQLGEKIEALKSVPGDIDDRWRKLWNGTNDEVDSAMLELLVAGGCAELGRSVEFLEATHESSPDLRCHDPFPLFIECKRKRPLGDYEIAEERVMRSLFEKLHSEATRKGMTGLFQLRLSVEAPSAPADDIVAALVGQRLAPRPSKALAHPWGEVAYHELPRRAHLPRATRLYSPNMLMATFGWETDLPEWDGLLCRIGNDGEPVVGTVERPVGLAWANVSPGAIRQRTWSPINLFGTATKQMPPGTFGIVYLAYHEGARDEVADMRVQAFRERLVEWEHSTSIRIPIGFLSRLYPRPLGDGKPDLIESTVLFCSEAYGEPLLFEEFPATVFTSRPT
jgi:hypothetical protein